MTPIGFLLEGGGKALVCLGQEGKFRAMGATNFDSGRVTMSEVIRSVLSGVRSPLTANPSRTKTKNQAGG